MGEVIEGRYKVVGEARPVADPRPIWEVRGCPNSQDPPWTLRRVFLTLWVIGVLSVLRYMLRYWGVM